MSRLETLRYKRHQGARKGITDKDKTAITERLPLLGDVIKAVSSSSYVTMAQSR